MRRCDEGIRRRDDLSGNSQCLQCRNEPYRCVGKQCDKFDAEILTKFLLELLVKWTAVGQDLAVPDFLQVGDELLEIREAWSRDVNRCVLLCFGRPKLL